MLTVLSPIDVARLHLGSLECPMFHVLTELDNQIVAMARRGPPKLLEYLVCTPAFVLILRTGGLEPQVIFFGQASTSS